LRVDGRTTDEIAEPHVLSILRDASPEQCEHFRRAMLAIDAGAAEFENAGAERLVGSETEFLFGVITVMARGGRAGLHAVGANDAAGGIVFECVFDEQVFAAIVEAVAVEAGAVGAFETFAEFEVEDAEAQAAGGVALLGSFCEGHAVTADLRMQARYLCRRRGCRNNGEPVEFHESRGIDRQCERNIVP